MKPAIVLIHGACRVPDHYFPLVSQLEASGYKVVLSKNPSVGSPALPDAFEADVVQARKNIVSELKAGRDIILVCHSYGGTVGCAALKELYEELGSNEADASDEALRDSSTLKGKVQRVVAYAAQLLPNGRSIEDELGGDITRWLTVKDGLVHLKTVESTSDNDTSDDNKMKAPLLTQPQAYETFIAKGCYEAWRHYPVTYVFADKEAGLVRPGSREPVVVRRLSCGHDIHAEMPKELAMIVREAAGEELGLSERF